MLRRGPARRRPAALLLVAGCGGGGTAPSAAGRVYPTDPAPRASSAASGAASPSVAATGLRLVTSIAANSRHVDPLAFSPDGKTLAGGRRRLAALRLHADHARTHRTMSTLVEPQPAPSVRS